MGASLQKSGKLIALLGVLAALLTGAAKFISVLQRSELHAKPTIHQESKAKGDGAKAFNAGRDLNVTE